MIAIRLSAAYLELTNMFPRQRHVLARLRVYSCVLIFHLVAYQIRLSFKNRPEELYSYFFGSTRICLTDKESDYVELVGDMGKEGKNDEKKLIY
jgi:hypothetical protein